MPTNKPRYTVIVDDELFEAIEDYRYVNRIPSRSEASVALIRLGIQALKEKAALSGGTRGPVTAEELLAEAAALQHVQAVEDAEA